MDKLVSETGRSAVSPSAEPDYAIWASKEYWSLSEAAKLICGRNPFEKYPGPQLYNRTHRVIDIIDQAFEACQSGEIKVIRNGLIAIHVLVEPASFTQWAIAQHLAVPDRLQSLTEVCTDAVETVTKNRLLKERVTTIARTLWIIDASLTQDQVFRHKAMQTLVDSRSVDILTMRAWIGEITQP